MRNLRCCPVCGPAAGRLLASFLVLGLASMFSCAAPPEDKPVKPQARNLGILGRTLQTLPAAASSRPTAVQLRAGDRIVAIGDSITAAGGYLAHVDAVLARARAKLELPEIVNAGVPGDCAEDLAARFRRDVLAAKPTVMTISVGVNDVGFVLNRPYDPAALAAYRESVAGMVDEAHAAGVRVILLAPTVIGEEADSEGNRRLRVYSDALARLAAEKGCGFADLHALFRQALEARPPDAPDEGWLTVDGIHMNARGDAVMAIGVLRALGFSDEEILVADSEQSH